MVGDIYVFTDPFYHSLLDVRTMTGQIVKCYGAGQVPTNISLHWSPSRPSWIWRHPLDILCGIAVLIKQKAKISARPK